MVGRDELDAFVRLDDLPSTFMNQAVVEIEPTMKSFREKVTI